MFRFREEKYTRENSPGEAVIHFGATHRVQIHNGAISREVYLTILKGKNHKNDYGNNNNF